MTIFFLTWFIIGVFNWTKAFWEFRKHPIVRPGIIEMFFFVLAGPIPNLNNLLKS